MALRRKKAIDPASRLEQLLAGQEKRIRQAFMAAVAVLSEGKLDELADLLAKGDIEAALSKLSSAAALLGNSYGEALAASARSTASFLSGALTVTVTFDGTNVRAVDAIQRNRLRLIREFSAEQRLATRNALTRGVQEGLNPRQQATRFRESIGLTQRQERAVARYRRTLQVVGRDIGGQPMDDPLSRRLRDKRFDASVIRARREGKPLTEAQVDRMVGRYRERYVKYRSEVIARTEALRSTHQGADEMYRQAIDAGELAPGELRRKWVAARDERTRGAHASASGQTRGHDEPFDVGGYRMMYPGDPAAPADQTVQCRCVLTTTLERED